MRQALSSNPPAAARCCVYNTSVAHRVIVLWSHVDDEQLDTCRLPLMFNELRWWCFAASILHPRRQSSSSADNITRSGLKHIAYRFSIATSVRAASVSTAHVVPDLYYYFDYYYWQQPSVARVRCTRADRKSRENRIQIVTVLAAWC